MASPKPHRKAECSNSIHYHFGELLDNDHILVHEVSVVDYLVNFTLAHLLSHAHHRLLEVLDRDHAIVVRVEHLQGVDQILDCFLILPSLDDDLLEDGKRKLAFAIGVDLSLNILNLLLSRV